MNHLRFAAAGLFLLTVSCRDCLSAEAPSVAAVERVAAPEGISRLMEGNRRFAEGRPLHMRQDPARRLEVAEGQHPFAVVLACSDSREAVEIITDQGLGDLFVIRVAGHVVDDIVLGSIEYAVEHLRCELVLVLGHERCGAVDAALGAKHLTGHVAKLVDVIRPGLPVEDAEASSDENLDRAVRANILRVVDELRSAQPLLKQRVRDRRLTVTGAYYDLHTGLIELLEQPVVPSASPATLRRGNATP